MIEVTLTLYTPWEMAVITEGMGIIQKAREAQKTTSTGGDIPAPPPVVETFPPKSGDPVYQEKDGTWHFYDETWSDSHGPFLTEAEARIVLKKYVEEELEGPPKVIATITAGGVTKPEPTPPAKGPSLADVEAAAHAHILKHGLPATRALVESYGGNQIKKVDEAKWPAMLAQLVGEVE